MMGIVESTVGYNEDVYIGLVPAHYFREVAGTSWACRRGSWTTSFMPHSAISRASARYLGTVSRLVRKEKEMGAIERLQPKGACTIKSEIFVVQSKNRRCGLRRMFGMTVSRPLLAIPLVEMN